MLTRSVACAGLEEKIKAIAAKRKMEDLTIGPVLTWTTDAMLGHMNKLLKLEGVLLCDSPRAGTAVIRTYVYFPS